MQVISNTSNGNAVAKLGGASALVLIFMSLVVPSAYVGVKACILVLAFGCSVILLLSKSVRLDRTTFFAMVSLAFVGLLYSFVGAINDTPGALRVLTVVFLWPLLYLVISSLLSAENAVLYLFLAMKWSLVAILAYSFLFVGNSFGLVPDLLYFELDQGQAIGFHEGFVEYNLYSIASLLFLAPLAVHYLYLVLKTNTNGRNFWFLLALGSICLVTLTGRRAMLLVLAATPLLIVATEILMQGGNVRLRSVAMVFVSGRMLLFCIVVAVAILFFFELVGLSFVSMWDMFVSGFDFGGNESATERSDQFYALMGAWAEGNMLIGAGNGAAVSVIRSYEQPWAYELTYVYLLFSTGLLGVLFYFTWFCYGLWRLRMALKGRPGMRIYVLPMVTGVFGFAIGAASNPYIGKFDFLWIIFLPHLLAGGLKLQGVFGAARA